jgi:DNA-binding transcriptional ArsR family regulator
MKNHDGVFQALADPTRRQILKLLQSRDLTPGSMLAHFSMTKPSLSHHLGILKKAGLVLTRRQGQNIHYSLNLSVFEETVAIIVGLLNPRRKNFRFAKEGKNHVKN